MSRALKPLILMYHRVAELSAVERYTVSPRQFSRQMRFLGEHDYHVIALATLMDWFTGKASLPERSVVLTFDDGFMDTYEQACPVLRERGFTAVFFMITGLLGKTNRWMTAEGYPSARLMDWREVENLRRDGFEIGSHTATHRDLTETNPAEAKFEIEDSKRMLEDRLGGAIDFFAYPYGRYSEDTRELVRQAGYRAACATAPGFVDRNQDDFCLTRVEVAGGDSLRAFAHKVAFGFNRFTCADLACYYARRIAAKALGS
jgi:peptidoglycan/xylan/chitin deacetylase (PgdA/CDA1 family)